MTKEEKSTVYQYMINQNAPMYNTLKLIEELNELSTALTQSLTKGIDDKEIIEEIGDVKFRLKVIEARYNKEDIEKRIEIKLKKNLEFINNKKFKNI